MIKVIRSFSFLLILLSGFACHAHAEQILSSETFGQLHVYPPHNEPKATIMFFSDLSGWTESLKNLSSSLADSGYLSIGVNTAEYRSQIESNQSGCAYLAGEIERLSQSVQSSLKLKNYRSPIIAGIGYGSALAYTINSQSPISFTGTIALNFCPAIEMKIPFCDSPTFKPNYDENRNRFNLPILEELKNRMLILNTKDTATCNIGDLTP